MVDAAVSQPACALLGRTWDGQGCRRDRCARATDAIRPAANAEVCLRGGPEGARYGNPIAEPRCRALHRRFVDAVNLCASMPERSRPLIAQAAGVRRAVHHVRRAQRARRRLRRVPAPAAGAPLGARGAAAGTSGRRVRRVALAHAVLVPVARGLRRRRVPPRRRPAAVRAARHPPARRLGGLARRRRARRPATRLDPRRRPRPGRLRARPPDRPLPRPAPAAGGRGRRARHQPRCRLGARRLPRRRRAAARQHPRRLGDSLPLLRAQQGQPAVAVAGGRSG